jgi:hypothetical protein
MLGMDQGQRSNAVGFNTSYLPNGEGSRHGAGTYSAQATEPTIQDYENFFGPSARDIKTDLQRFKRHGRWHLPDILQGPNPWLTDRIDGLITDATNSPFTTKILPYRYKEEVDGKIKWNVWSFDEGMASRVPYESAARTLTQSKRSFAGYMVRQGMAIVLEHNFMMTPQGRENFKNQLNQLIGSIQYTNDLDVHMALVLAPSYQKTMRERYYTSDKSAAQTCREFADLFGMMQKNVNALDILIEEGKAILRTWGGPMPDFLLCNSKLTFQMTMTPEKTNYITQGIDGVKRLRQGPDLGSYRGLSVIHSRSFAMETGQHPRDILRRRVRTAEYYRIPPNKKNVNREFEFYNEERDAWFTLSFQDLLKYARYMDSGDDNDNASRVDAVYHRLSGAADAVQPHEMILGEDMMTLGARIGIPLPLRQRATDLITGATVAYLRPVESQRLAGTRTLDNVAFPELFWYRRGLSADLGVKFIAPKDCEVWDNFQTALAALGLQGTVKELMKNSLSVLLSREMIRDLYLTLKGRPLRNPFQAGQIAAPGSAQWFGAYAFYADIVRRGGIQIGRLNLANTDIISADDLLNAALRNPIPKDSDFTAMMLGFADLRGNVNHPMNLYPNNDLQAVDQALFDRIRDERGTSFGTVVGYSVLLTVDVLEPLLREYNVNGRRIAGIDYLLKFTAGRGQIERLFASFAASSAAANMTEISVEVNQALKTFLDNVLNLEIVDGHVNAGELLAENGVSTFPMFGSTVSHLFHHYHLERNRGVLKTVYETSLNSFGHLSIDSLLIIARNVATLENETILSVNGVNSAGHPWSLPYTLGNINPAYNIAGSQEYFKQFFTAIKFRLFYNSVPELDNWTMNDGIPASAEVSKLLYAGDFERALITRSESLRRRTTPPDAYMTGFFTSDGPPNIVFDLNKLLQGSSPPRDLKEVSRKDLQAAENVELVIVRPNIEHNMLGVIMGLGGESLGNTLWGQTELSVYDDSMHGIWGMSYKYHERAIVFNEKNLIRMWDIAYDGYNGGKDDTYVNWMQRGDDSARFGPDAFKRATLDLSQNYRGPSMMVMAFVHDRTKLDDNGRNLFDTHFRRNWPSPIVFYDTYDSRNRQHEPEVLPVDYDNVMTVDVEEFRVFNNELYSDAFKGYRQMMPEFKTMHLTRKTAGQSSADAETSSDCLAFQGSMRIKESGMTVQDILGSGHHGPDYVGIASVRAGKGQKVAGQAPAPYRLV